jgi:Neuraminidase (sialidase)
MNVLATAGLIVSVLIAPTAHADDNVFKTVVAPATREHPRSGEGDILPLRDGRLMLVYSRFDAGATADDSPASICRRYSSDGGRTWTADEVLIPNDAMNLMSVSLLRLQSGEIMLVYGRRHSNAKMQFYARFSRDEGKTWDPKESLVTPIAAYQTINNARVIQLKGGRLLAPVAMCRGKTWKDDYFFFAMTYASDDDGRTWKPCAQRLTVPGCSYGADEPAVMELTDGRVMMLIRTDVGKIWRSFSKDGGETWSAPQSTTLDSPSSPATIRRLPTGDLLLVWNNAKPAKDNAGVPRSPLTTAISRDEGETWQHARNLEDAPGGNFCYVSATSIDGGRTLLSYYERGGLKMTAVNDDWFYGRQ